MQIVAHRGQWSSPSDKNSRNAFALASANANGIETDMRDMPSGGEIWRDELLAIAMYEQHPHSGPLALNYLQQGVLTYTRASEDENPPLFQTKPVRSGWTLLMANGLARKMWRNAERKANKCGSMPQPCVGADLCTFGRCCA